MSRPVHIAYVTTYDPNDRLRWSGLGHAIMESLRAQDFKVTPIGPLQERFRWIGRVKNRFYRHVFGRTHAFEREALVGWDYAKQISTRLEGAPYDIVFSPGTIAISRLRCRQPIVFWADATFGSLISHYTEYQKLSAASVRAGYHTEQIALQRCALAIYASDWAAQSAIRMYGADPAKVKVVAFGANLLEPPARDAALQSIATRSTDVCRLITIGVDWIRKGIPRAIELATALNARGLPTRLTVVGCQPPTNVAIPEYVEFIGFLNKQSGDGENRLGQLLAASHFHVLFSTAECFGVVFAEANAYAVPNIASDVGGIGSAVSNGRGGQRFDLAAPIQQVADYVETHWRSRGLYEALARSARQEYDDRLNWKSAGRMVKEYLDTLVQNDRSAPHKNTV